MNIPNLENIKSAENLSAKNLKEHLKTKGFPDKIIEKLVEITSEGTKLLNEKLENIMNSNNPQFVMILHMISLLGMITYFCSLNKKCLKEIYQNEEEPNLKDFLKHLDNLEMIGIEFFNTFVQYLHYEE